MLTHSLSPSEHKFCCVRVSVRDDKMVIRPKFTWEICFNGKENGAGPILMWSMIGSSLQFSLSVLVLDCVVYLRTRQRGRGSWAWWMSEWRATSTIRPSKWTAYLTCRKQREPSAWAWAHTHPPSQRYICISIPTQSAYDDGRVCK